MLSRRAVLRASGLGVVGAGLCVTAAVSLDQLLGDGPDDDPGEAVDTPDPAPTLEPGPVVRGSFVSEARGGVITPWSLIRPPGVSGPLPLVMALHGLDGSTDDLLGPEWDLPGALARAVAVDGVAPFAIATASGGTSFWHRRPWGEDAGAMVLDELLPMLLDRDDVVTTPIGLLGWSMGAYGALRMAGILGSNRVAAVVASSPGLYLDPARAHRDGFVDAAEYERFSVMDDQDLLADIPLRIDIGTADPFLAATRAYVDGFGDAAREADLQVEYGEGGHEISFTRRVMPAQLAFLGRHVGRGTAGSLDG